ncbi:hypothetical protein VQ042_11810 [Aurantimonas sp. A2-1-M11]|uniref:hypothetical protein n=1 Tax=Aurantimonas sp. A2-1-M11 TaxID=3113712 RepID=UPI002F92D267
MKYQQPFGVLDPDASYEDGNRVTGTKGSIPPAKAVEQDMRELVHLIEYAGIVPADDDLQQVRKAIETLIDAATGGGDVSQFLTLLMARSRLPIFPEIQTADGRMNVSSPGAGTILVPAAVTFQHRGIYPVSTSDYPEVDRTFETLANKTYHCRWAYGAGFSLTDAEDAAYNAGALPEQDAAFDSTYDDMLVARVVTNSSNVATITNLANKDRLQLSKIVDGVNTSYSGQNFATFSVTDSYNWARTPGTKSLHLAQKSGGVDDADFKVAAQGIDGAVVSQSSTPTQIVADRYGLRTAVMSDDASSLKMNMTVTA